MGNDPVQSNGDLVERSQALEAFGGSEVQFRALVEALPDAIMVHINGKIIFANPFCVRLLGMESADSLVGKDIFQFIDQAYREAIRKRIESCYADNTASHPTESVMTARDGSSIDVEAVAIPITWNGSPAIEVVLRDIRKRKQAERAADDWRRRFELAQKAGLRIGLWDWDVSANTVAWSDETYRQFGFTRETFSGNVEEAVKRIHPEDQARVGASIQEVVLGDGEYAACYRVVHPSGKVCWIDARGVVVRNGSTHMMGVGLDITHLKQSEDMLRRSEEKYRGLFENAIHGIFRADFEGRLLEVNSALVTMLGYSSKEELLKQNLSRDVYENVSVRDAILVSAAGNDRTVGAEVNWRRKDGKTIPVRLSGRVVHSDDESPILYEVIAEDISGRRSLEAQLLQSQKMEAIGQLAGGISHDFNNLLSVILGNAELLMETNPSKAQRHHADAIRQAAGRAAELTRQLLAFSRKQVLFPTLLDLNEVVRDMAKILKRLIGEDVCVQLDLRSEIGSVRTDRGQIEQILMNLATNARGAMPNGGTLTIRTENCEITPKEVTNYPGAKVGEYVRLSVSDNGVGMSEEVRSRVFEPFFTTKAPGSGTGLGLATVYGSVKQSGGYVWVSSSPGQGATFALYFPRVQQKAPRKIKVAENHSPDARANETILLVEDELALQEVTSELLEASGYTVLRSGRADEAIRAASAYQGQIALIISDVVLPDEPGPKAVEKLHALHPEAKVLYISGYAEMPVAQQLAAHREMFLQKPFSRATLLGKVDSILHNQPATVSR